MYEKHENEQYFFDEATLDHLGNFLGQWSAPCCLCAPSLGKHLAERGVNVAILDIDKRFSATKGFRYFDIFRPEWLGTDFDLIFCDPPFFNVSLSQLFAAIRMLSQNNFEQTVLVSYLARRSKAITNTFASFKLQGTDYFPKYQTVRDTEKNRIEVFSNLSPELATAFAKT